LRASSIARTPTASRAARSSGRSSARSGSASSGSSSIPPWRELTTPSLDGSRRLCPATPSSSCWCFSKGARCRKSSSGGRGRPGRSVRDPRSEPAIRGMRAEVRLWSAEAARLRHRPARVVVRVASRRSTRGPPAGSTDSGGGRRPASYRSALGTDRTNCRLPSARGAEPRSRSLPTAMPIGTELRNHTSRILTITALSLRWSSVLPRPIDTLAGEVDGEMKRPRRVA
jgi:hypothetical protein